MKTVFLEDGVAVGIIEAMQLGLVAGHSGKNVSSISVADSAAVEIGWVLQEDGTFAEPTVTDPAAPAQT